MPEIRHGATNVSASVGFPKPVSMAANGRADTVAFHAFDFHVSSSKKRNLVNVINIQGLGTWKYAPDWMSVHKSIPALAIRMLPWMHPAKEIVASKTYAHPAWRNMRMYSMFPA